MGLNSSEKIKVQNKQSEDRSAVPRPDLSVSAESGDDDLGSTDLQKTVYMQASLDGDAKADEIYSLKISMVEPRKNQPRATMDDESLQELADSIRLHGLLQPILVRKKGLTYEIIAGERRWRASRMAGLKEIPAVVKELDDREMAEAALIENIQREDLNPVEEARAFKTLISDYGLTQEELGVRLSKSRAAITNSLRLLNLDDEILKMLEDGLLQAGHARAILGISAKDKQLKAAKDVVEHALSVRDTEKLAKKYNSKVKKPEKTHDDVDYSLYLKDLANRLTEAMNTKVSIKRSGLHKGHISIEYYSEEELNDLAERLL